MDTILCTLFALVPLMCLCLAASIEEKEPPSYLDIWYGEDT